jgi:hypothetical protein
VKLTTIAGEGKHRNKLWVFLSMSARMWSKDSGSPYLSGLLICGYMCERQNEVDVQTAHTRKVNIPIVSFRGKGVGMVRKV